MSTRIKICGNRTVAEAAQALSCGADAVGILVGPHSESQKHFVSEEIASEILRSLPPFAVGVLVTTYNTIESIRLLIKTANPTVVQCHSDITYQSIAQLKVEFPAVRFIAVIHVQDNSSITEATKAARHADALLLDTAYKGIPGGTGVAHDWNISASIISSVQIPVILAGGLNPENVAAAVNMARPYAVDVRSGVSLPDGSRNEEKMRSFIHNARTV